LLLTEGVKIGHIQLNCLWPLSLKLKNIVNKFEYTIIVEMNNGQLYNLLRVKIAPKAKSVTQISGKPFRISYLKEKFKNIIDNGKLNEN